MTNIRHVVLKRATYTIPAGQLLRISEFSNFFKVHTTTASVGELKVQFDNQEKQIMEAGDYVKTPDEKRYDHVTLWNDGGNSFTVTIITSNGDVGSEKLSLSGTITTSSGTSLETLAPVTVSAHPTAAKICDADPNATQTIIQTASTTPFYIGDSTVTTTNGTRVFTNQTVVYNGGVELWGVGDGGTVFVRIQRMKK